ncbi:hypothetical protein, conserved [Leishmania lindenbergi]|uniref:Uncharacterized protein n=1 Tax=Leishmania lindenbergi TaxID=651832 RepID=A0AAW3AMY2_9TRYP
MDLFTRNQHYSALHQEMLRLKGEYAVLQKRNTEAEERNTQLHQQRAKLEVSVEQLGREVGQGRTALDALRAKLVRREEELQFSQSRVAESLVAISQKEAVISTLRRELGKCGQLRYGSACWQRDGVREGEEDGQSEGGNAHAYTADMLGRIAADVEGRSQEARMKLKMADLEGRLSRLSEERDSILSQHTQYRQHVQLTLQTYEAEAMLREDTLARHVCVYTPYFTGEQEELYSKVVNLQTGVELTTDQRGKDGEIDVAAGADAPPPLQSFRALTFEIRRAMDRLSKMHIDESSRLQQDLSLCVDAQRISLQTGAELVGFLSAMEEEVLQRRLTLPEVREEWRKSRVPEFTQAIAQSLQESARRLGRGLVGLLRQENNFVEEVEQARAFQQEQKRMSTAGGKDQQPRHGDRAGGTSGRNRSDPAAGFRPGGRDSCFAAPPAGGAEWRKESLKGAGAGKVPSASMTAVDGQGSGVVEKKQPAAFTTSARSSATAGAQNLRAPPQPAEQTSAPTPPPTETGGPPATSETHENSATGAADMRASPESQSTPTISAQTDGDTTNQESAAEIASAAGPTAEAGPEGASQSAQDALVSPATLLTTTQPGDTAGAADPTTTAPPSAVLATPSPKDPPNKTNSPATVAEQKMAGGMGTLRPVSSVVVCPHCEHEVLFNVGAGEPLPIPADSSSSGGGGTRGSLAAPNAAAAASHEPSYNASLASASLAGEVAVPPTKSGESACAAQGSGVTATTNTQRGGTRRTNSTAVTKPKDKKNPGSPSGTAKASSKRTKKHSLTGSRDASSSPAPSPMASANHSQSPGTRTSGKHSSPKSAPPELAHGEQQINLERGSFSIGVSTSQTLLHSHHTMDDVGSFAAELELALSDCQDRLKDASEELQEMRAANAALHVQLAAALAAAAASALAPASSTSPGAGSAKGMSGSSGATGPGDADEVADAATEEAVRVSGRLVEADRVAVPVNHESCQGGGFASTAPPPRPSPYAGVQKYEVANSDGPASASTPGAAAGGKGGRAGEEHSNAVSYHHTPNLPSIAASPAAHSLLAGCRGTHGGEELGTTDSTSAPTIAAAGGSQSTTRLQQSCSNASRVKHNFTGSSGTMDDGAEQSHGDSAASGATSTHNNISAPWHERLLLSVSPPLQSRYSKRVGGGLAATAVTPQQTSSTSPPTLVWGSVLPPVLNRRPHALTGGAASNTNATGAAAVHRANATSASIPHKMQTLGLMITNSRGPYAPAKQPERVEPGAYASATTKGNGESYTNRAGVHSISFKQGPASPPSLADGLCVGVFPLLPPLSPSQVPSQLDQWNSRVPFTRRGRPPTSGSNYSSPIPMSVLPTVAVPGTTHLPHSVATVPATSPAAVPGLSVWGSPILSLNPPSFSCSTAMSPQSVSVEPPSPNSGAVTTAITAAIQAEGSSQAHSFTNATHAPAATTALSKSQRLKNAYQQLRFCLSQGVSPLYSGCGDPQPFQVAKTVRSVQVPGRRLGGAWYSTHSSTGPGGGLQKVMTRPMRGTWLRGRLYEAPIFASPASVPMRDTNLDFDVIVGGHSVVSYLSAPYTPSGHLVARPWQEAPAQPLQPTSGAAVPPALTYLATPTEKRRRWSCNRFDQRRYDPFALSAASRMDAMAPCLRQRMPRTWQQQKQRDIRQSGSVATSGTLARAPYAPVKARVVWSAGGQRAQLLPITLAQSRAAQLAQFQFAAPSAGQLPVSDLVTPLFALSGKRRRRSCRVQHWAKRDPMQRAVKRTVYTVSAASLPLVHLREEALDSCRLQNVHTPLLPPYHEQ